MPPGPPPRPGLGFAANVIGLGLGRIERVRLGVAGAGVESVGPRKELDDSTRADTDTVLLACPPAAMMSSRSSCCGWRCTHVEPLCVCVWVGRCEGVVVGMQGLGEGEGPGCCAGDGDGEGEGEGDGDCDPARGPLVKVPMVLSFCSTPSISLHSIHPIPLPQLPLSAHIATRASSLTRSPSRFTGPKPKTGMKRPAELNPQPDPNGRPELLLGAPLPLLFLINCLSSPVWL